MLAIIGGTKQDVLHSVLTFLINMVFNSRIENKQVRSMHSDSELIEALGGTTKVAARLGYSVQRVQNWKERGIPAQVRLDHPGVFPAPPRHQDAAQPEYQPQ
jgi:hypothetical protein